jgi:ribosome-binding protein aMBF1 (putative translation factor)
MIAASKISPPTFSNTTSMPSGARRPSLANSKVKTEYDALAPEFEIAAELLRARLRAGLSQAELAARMGTSQSTIARLEGGQTLPSTKTLLRYAEATGSKFHVRLSAA